MDEISTGVAAPPDSGAAPAAVESPTTFQGSGTPSTESSQGSVTAPVQGESTSSQDDAFNGIPSTEELQELVKQNAPNAKAVAQLRAALEEVNPKYKELQKFEPFAPHLGRFEKPEQLQEAIGWHDKLFGAYERDERNQLVPATQAFAAEIAQKDALVADYLSADLMNGETIHPETGERVPRINLAIELMRHDPERRATALRLLGGVEPTSIAPTWQPSADELLAIQKDPERPTSDEQALQDIYRNLPYDEREELKANNPDFIRNYLKKEQFQQNLMRENRAATERQQTEDARREAYMTQRAEQAGNEYVETQFRQGFAEFANSVVERTNFIAPIDPGSEAAQGMAPEQVTQFNQQAQQINTGIGKMVATVTAALSHPDTRWFAEDFLKSVGVDEQTISAFDQARTEFARNARDYGELNFTRTAGQNGNGNGNAHAGLGTLQSNATSAMKTLRGHANLISQPLIKMLSQFFEVKAGSYNQSLNGGSVRPAVNGNHFSPATELPARPQGFMSRAEIERQYGS